MVNPVEPFIGSEAVARGRLNSHLLRSHYQAVLPDVYVSKGVRLDLVGRARAAWLWSHRGGIVMGLTAAGLHGAKWVDDGLPIELVWSNARSPEGVRTHALRLAPDEWVTVAGIPVTTPVRTAFDLGRRRPARTAVGRVDALLSATKVRPGDVAALAKRHRGARGLRQLEAVLDLVDPAAQSPKESWLRMVLVDGGLPRPRTQIPVQSSDGWTTYFLDMGWDDFMVAVEYDGEQHRVDRRQYRKDIRRLEELERLGWLVIRVIVGDTEADVLSRVRVALMRRGWRGSSLRRAGA